METLKGTLKLEQSDVQTAIQEYLKAKGYTLVRAIVNEGIILAEVTRDLATAMTNSTVGKKITAYRKAKKHAKVNTGLFTVLKQWFEEERKAGTKEIPFHTVQTKLKANYPHLTEDRLAMYLYDRRQLPTIRFRKTEGVIKLLA